MTQSQKFTEAWRIAKVAHSSFKYYGSVKQYFAEALKLVNKLGKVAVLTLKEQITVKNCLGAGARILNWTSEYISDTESRIFAETFRNNKVNNRTYYFDHNSSSLTVLN